MEARLADVIEYEEERKRPMATMQAAAAHIRELEIGIAEWRHRAVEAERRTAEAA